MVPASDCEFISHGKSLRIKTGGFLSPAPANALQHICEVDMSAFDKNRQLMDGLINLGGVR
jgi:hypothetical protein